MSMLEVNKYAEKLPSPQYAYELEIVIVATIMLCVAKGSNESKVS